MCCRGERLVAFSLGFAFAAVEKSPAARLENDFGYCSSFRVLHIVCRAPTCSRPHNTLTGGGVGATVGCTPPSVHPHTFLSRSMFIFLLGFWEMEALLWKAGHMNAHDMQ